MKWIDIGMIIGILGVLIASTAAIIDSNSEKINVEIKCYDNYNNEIKGAVCYDEKLAETNYITAIAFPLGFMTAFIGSILMIVAPVLDMRR